ncbi:MAG: response regulator [Bosea sp.]|nr:response regulator [Bosea sp. (in: a-proteobacteria)]
MSPEGCVIIVDDDDAVRQSLMFSLALEGFQVRAFRNGEELLAERELPARACLVIDYCMPSLDGLSLVDRLRQSAIALPAILITAKATAEIRRRAALCGCRAVLEKPLEDNSLADCIRDVLTCGGAEELHRPG